MKSPPGEGCGSKTIPYLMPLKKHICVSWKDSCYWRIHRSFDLAFTNKICMRKILELFFGPFFGPFFFMSEWGTAME